MPRKCKFRVASPWGRAPPQALPAHERRLLASDKSGFSCLRCWKRKEPRQPFGCWGSHLSPWGEARWGNQRSGLLLILRLTRFLGWALAISRSVLNRSLVVTTLSVALCIPSYHPAPQRFDPCQSHAKEHQCCTPVWNSFWTCFNVQFRSQRQKIAFSSTECVFERASGVQRPESVTANLTAEDVETGVTRTAKRLISKVECDLFPLVEPLIIQHEKPRVGIGHPLQSGIIFTLDVEIARVGGGFAR
jgi:hypothetical protein